MIKGQRVLALITARGGSKELPKKNILPLGGKPLVAWSINAAQQSRYLDHIAISSDDHEIIQIAQKHGCEAPFVRPPELASDAAETLDVAIHALELLPEYEILVILQPTSPLRTAADIDTALEIMLKQGARSCVSVVEPDKSPYWAYQLNDKGYMRPLLDPKQVKQRRQDLPMTYVPNGALYIIQTDWLLKSRHLVDENTLAYIMPKERSIDVDSEHDLKIAELYLGNQVQ